ncbi:M1-specific T cell receptor alpha chain-like [Scyliorhinus canicula]|uniref:M1-specific T cell receptor alpha chain-like n=1 Tax=Scyliorhinus canicula TaxID=7830 RepID=UPI0018F6ED30|nr:M1-specific T cell receptor alpha chain-like [Scyliorhinus canicula]
MAVSKLHRTRLPYPFAQMVINDSEQLVSSCLRSLAKLHEHPATYLLLSGAALPINITKIKFYFDMMYEAALICETVRICFAYKKVGMMQDHACINIVNVKIEFVCNIKLLSKVRLQAKYQAVWGCVNLGMNKLIFGIGTKLIVEPMTVMVGWEIEPSCKGISQCVTIGGNNKLVFGSGTKLIVNPESDYSEPSVYVLPPRGNQPNVSPVCLVTDYFPNNVSVSVKNGAASQERNHSYASLSIADRSYSMVGFLNSPASQQDEKFECTVGGEWRTLPEAAQVKRQCIAVEEDSDGVEHLNTLSLTVIGLRILFLKSIVFNALMTFRIWVS